MIINFSVDNFLSFSDRQELSFEATPDNTSEESLVMTVVHPKSGNTSRVLRLAAIYGANASGKTNLLYAIADILNKMYVPNTSRDEKILFRPFAMRKDDNTKMTISFFVGGIRYDYSIEYNDHCIVNELLEFNPNGVSSLFYERTHNTKTNMPVVSFGKNAALDSKAISILTSNTLPNHSVLSTYNKVSVDAPEIEKVIGYLRKLLLNKSQSNINLLLQDTLQRPLRKDYLLRAVKEADFNITDIISKPTDRNEPEIEFEHTFGDGRFTMTIDSESDGTLSFIKNMDILYAVIADNRFIMIDELDKSLHHDLMVYYLQTFLMNESEAQILFTVHDQLILSEDFMRRDTVWFTEKNKHTASTELFSADDFNLHKNASIFNAYKLGKLGARPHVGSPFFQIKPSSYEKE